MRADYGFKPVPRDYEGPIDSEGSNLDHDLPPCDGDGRSEAS